MVSIHILERIGKKHTEKYLNYFSENESNNAGYGCGSVIGKVLIKSKWKWVLWE